MSGVNWTTEELAKLHKLYPIMQNKALARVMAPRSAMSLKQMANRLGIVKQYPMQRFAEIAE